MRRRLSARHLRISAQSALDEQVAYMGANVWPVSDACRTFRSSTISSDGSSPQRFRQVKAIHANNVLRSTKCLKSVFGKADVADE